MKPEGRDVDLFLTGSRWSARNRKERRVCRGRTHGRVGGRAPGTHGGQQSRQQAGGAGGRQHAWQGAAGQGLHSMVHARSRRNRAEGTGRGVGGAGQEEKEKKEAQEIKRGSGVYIGVVESS